MQMLRLWWSSPNMKQTDSIVKISGVSQLQRWLLGDLTFVLKSGTLHSSFSHIYMHACTHAHTICQYSIASSLFQRWLEVDMTWTCWVGTHTHTQTNKYTQKCWAHQDSMCYPEGVTANTYVQGQETQTHTHTHTNMHTHALTCIHTDSLRCVTRKADEKLTKTDSLVSSWCFLLVRVCLCVRYSSLCKETCNMASIEISA